MSLRTDLMFRAIALSASAVVMGITWANVLATDPGSWLQSVGTGRSLALLALHLSAGDLPIGRSTYLCLSSLAFVSFALAFWCGTRNGDGSSTARALLLAVQILVGALDESDLLFLVAAELAFVMPSRDGLAWLAVLPMAYGLSTLPTLLQTASGLAHCNVPEIAPPAGVWLPLEWSRQAAFHLLAFCVGHTASTQMRSRAALAALHTELTSAQAQLEQAIRVSEQDRIAQRVHETLDQHLSALHAELASAGRHLAGPAKAAVQTSLGLAQQLMSEVKTVVATERDTPPLDLLAALRAMSTGLPKPRIELNLDAHAACTSPALAHTLFRMMQEGITNAIRHADATLLRIGLTASEHTLTLRIDDNGRGRQHGEPAALGSGLRGMRDRAAAHGGTFMAGNRDEGGFAIVVTLPLGERPC